MELKTSKDKQSILFHCIKLTNGKKTCRKLTPLNYHQPSNTNIHLTREESWVIFNPSNIKTKNNELKHDFIWNINDSKFPVSYWILGIFPPHLKP